MAKTVSDALAMLAESAERDAVATGLGAIVGELYVRKLERWQRQQSERAKVAESEEYIDAEPVLEGFADTVRHASVAGRADE